MAGWTRTLGHVARMRSAAAGALCAGGFAVLLAAGCSSGRPSPPDMPPFAGTQAFLQEQLRVRRAAAAEAALQEKIRQGDPVASQRRFRAFLEMQRETAELARREALLQERRRR